MAVTEVKVAVSVVGDRLALLEVPRYFRLLRFYDFRSDCNVIIDSGRKAYQKRN